MASSKNYTTKASAFVKIESVRKNAATASVDGLTLAPPSPHGPDVAAVQAEGQFEAAVVIVRLRESGYGRSESATPRSTVTAFEPAVGGGGGAGRRGRTRGWVTPPA